MGGRSTYRRLSPVPTIERGRSRSSGVVLGRFWRSFLLLGCALALALSGCTPVRPAAGSAAPTVITTGPIPAVALDGIAERLNKAAAGRRPADFLATFTTAAQRLGLDWYRTQRAAGGRVEVSADATALTLVGALPGDRGTATDVLAVHLAPQEGRYLIDGVAATTGTPLWALGAAELTSGRYGTLISTGLDQAARRRWANRLQRAAIAVAGSGLIAAAAHWSPVLLVEVPARTEDFVTVSGVAADGAAAVTQCSSGSPRIVVNPVLPDAWAQATLTHEAVHVATASPCHAGAPSWVVEGLAEAVAAAAEPKVARQNAALVRSYLRDHPVPDALPNPQDDQTDYALAQLCVDQVVRRLGRTEAANLLYRAIAGPTGLAPAELDDVTTWYRAELLRLSQKKS